MDDRVKELARIYKQMKYEKMEVRTAVRKRYAPIIEQEISNEIEALERRFGQNLVSALSAGYTRSELEMSIFGSKSGGYNRFVELGGGTIREKMSAEESEARRVERERLRMETNAKIRDMKSVHKEQTKRENMLAEIGLELAEVGAEHPYRLLGTGEAARIEIDDVNRALQGRSAWIAVPGNFERQSEVNEHTTAWSVKVRDVYLMEHPDEVIPNEGRGKGN